MTSILFASRDRITLPPAALSEWSRFGLTWDGWDGSRWDLRDLNGGVFVTNEGITGLHDPSWELQTSVSPGRAGRRRLGARTQERSFKLPIYMVDDDGSREWQRLKRAFFHSLHPERPGTLTLTSSLGERKIQLYYDGAADYAYTRDPIYSGCARYPLNLTAEDPYWTGLPVVRSWEQVAPQPFFGDDGNLWIGSGAALELASIEHDGDVSAWVEWVVRAKAAPVTARIGVDGGWLGPPLIPAGGELVIDTEPSAASADLNGEEVDGEVDPWDPRPVPEGRAVPLSLQLSGPGSVTARITPRYWHGF